MLRQLPVVVVLNAKVIDNLKQEGEVEQREVQPVLGFRYRILHPPVDAKEVERLDEQVGRQQENDVEQEFALHGRNIASLFVP